MAQLIDHTLTFANEAAAFAVLENLGFAGRDDENNLVWDRSRVDPGVKLITADAVWDHTDLDNPILISPEETIAGFHISIALPEASDALEALPGNVLRVIENRELATSIKAFHEYAVAHKSLPEGVASNMPVGDINRQGGKIENLTFKTSPRFLGSDYPVPF